MSTPIIALDIDGTFSPVLLESYFETDDVYLWDLNDKAWPLGDDGESPMIQTNCMNAYVARPVADFFKRVHETGLARVMWHSTWGEDAKRFEAELGLPSFEVLFNRYSKGKTHGVDGKLEDVKGLLDSDERVIWLDDHIVKTSENAHILDHENLFWLAPGPGSGIGLTASDLAVVEKILKFWS